MKVYGGRPLDRSNPRIRDMVDAVTRIKAAATRLATLPRTLDVEVEASEALATLLAEVTGPDMTIPPDPEEHAVELLGWLELPLDDAPAVIVTGVNERILPEAVGADPFLPGALRSFLGIPDDEARYARDAYLLSALIQSRDEVHLIAGRLTAQGDPLRPSRLLFAAEPEDVAKRIRRYLGDEDEGDGGPCLGARVPNPGLRRPKRRHSGLRKPRTRPRAASAPRPRIPPGPGLPAPDPGHRLRHLPLGPLPLCHGTGPESGAAGRRSPGDGRGRVREPGPRGPGAVRAFGGSELQTTGRRRKEAEPSPGPGGQGPVRPPAGAGGAGTDGAASGPLGPLRLVASGVGRGGVAR